MAFMSALFLQPCSLLLYKVLVDLFKWKDHFWSRSTYMYMDLNGQACVWNYWFEHTCMCFGIFRFDDCTCVEIFYRCLTFLQILSLFTHKPVEGRLDARLLDLR